MPASPWAAWRPATCMPDHCFCEQIAPSLVRQPANAASSLAFVAAGVWVLWRFRRDLRSGRLFYRHPVYPTLFGAACSLIGLGSAFYHASLTFAGQFVDVFGMYLIGTFVLLYNVGRRRVVGPGAVALAYVALNGALALSLYFVPAARRYLFGMLILAAIGLEVSAQRRSGSSIDRRHLTRAICALAAGFILWILDITKVFCRPESLLQLHAVWHLLGAVSAACIYLYYRSETDGTAPPRGG